MRRSSVRADTPRLFEMPVEAGQVANVHWSYSRRSTLETCARRYYDEYYGGSRSVALTDPAKDELIFLKGVQNRFLRTGEILHQAIARYLRSLQKDELPSEENLVAWCRRTFQEDRRYSSKYKTNQIRHLEPGNPPALIHEFVYDVPGAAALCDEAEQRMVEAFHAFVTDVRFGAFRFGATNPSAVVEQRFTLTGLPCRVGGMIDLAYPAGERVVIVDWKLGGDSGSGSDSLQLAIYALWAIDRFGRTPEMIDVYRAHLSCAEVVSFSVDRRKLAAARARIVQDAITMATIDRYGIEGVFEAFTPRGDIAICRHCSFVRACPAGKEVTRA